MIIRGDCRDVLKKIKENRIDLVITSPPYDNLRLYSGTLEWGDHIWKPVIRQLYRVIKPGGVVVWVVGDATIKGSETGTSFRQSLYAIKCGFNLHDTMIWNKRGFSATGSLSSRYAPVFEYMFVWSKGKVKTFHPIKDRPNKRYGETVHGTIRKRDGGFRSVVGAGKKRIAKYGQRWNIWEINPAKGKKSTNHPAEFPNQLVHDHIISWSNRGDLILDPFAGSGTVGCVAKRLERKYILIEKVPEYIKMIKQKVEEA